MTPFCSDIVGDKGRAGEDVHFGEGRREGFADAPCGVAFHGDDQIVGNLVLVVNQMDVREVDATAGQRPPFGGDAFPEGLVVGVDVTVECRLLLSDEFRMVAEHGGLFNVDFSGEVVPEQVVAAGKFD